MELNSTGSATALQGLRPYALGKEEGQAIWFLGTLTFVKATKASTGGAYGLIEQAIPAGFSSPYHVHHDEDEAFYVLEGQITFYCGDQRLKGGPGAYVFGPREIPHGFKVEGDHPARLLLLASPGGFEQFVIDASTPATELRVPAAEAPDMPKLMALAAKYNIEILGPLPE